MSDEPAPPSATPTPTNPPPTPGSTLLLDPHLRRVALMIGYMVIIAGFAVAFTLLWPLIEGIFSILAPFLVAMVVAYLFNPVVNFVQRRLGLSRVWGVLAVNAIILLVLALIVAFLIPVLTTQVRTASDNVGITARERVGPWLSERLATPPQPEAPLLTAFEAEMAKLAPDIDKPALVTADALSPKIEEFFGAQAPDTAGVDDLKRLIEDWQKANPGAEIDAGKLRLAARTWARDASGSGWAKGLLQRGEDFLNDRGYTLESLAERVVGSAKVAETAQRAASEGADLLGRLVVGILGVLQWLFSSVLFLVFVLLISFYLLIDFASLRGVIEVVTPESIRARLFDVLGKIDVAVGGFIRGQLIVAVCVGTLTAIGLTCVGLGKYALLIGLFAGTANLIPYLGSIAGATPAVLIVLFSDDFSENRWLFLGLTIGIFVAIQVIESLILSPYIVGQSAQLHPVVVILGLTAGAQFGILGAMLALPVTCIVRVLVKEFFWDERHEKWHETTGKRRLDDLAPRRRKPNPATQKTEGTAAEKTKEPAEKDPPPPPPAA